MKNNPIVSIFLLLILFVCTAFLDYGYSKLEDIYGPQFQFGPLYLYKFIASILWAAMVLGVAWYVLVANPRSNNVAIIYLLIGAFLLFSQIFFSSFYYLLGPLAQPTQGLRMRILDIFWSHLSLSIHTAAMVGVIGAARLFPDRLLKPTAAHQDKLGESSRTELSL